MEKTLTFFNVEILSFILMLSQFITIVNRYTMYAFICLVFSVFVNFNKSLDYAYIVLTILILS